MRVVWAVALMLSLAGCFGDKDSGEESHEHGSVEASLSVDASSVPANSTVAFSMNATAMDHEGNVDPNATIPWVLEYIDADELAAFEASQPEATGNETGNETEEEHPDANWTALADGASLPGEVETSFDTPGDYVIRLTAGNHDMGEDHAEVSLFVTANQTTEPEPPEEGTEFPHEITGTVTGAATCTDSDTSPAATEGSGDVPLDAGGRSYSATLTGTTVAPDAISDLCLTWLDENDAALAEDPAGTVPMGTVKVLVNADFAYNGSWKITIT